MKGRRLGGPGVARDFRILDVTAYGPLEVGDVLSARSGGGGGHGSPE